MYDALKKHTIDTTWCSPQQDNQIIGRLSKITKKGGDIVSTQIMTRRIALPDSKQYYHVFFVGQIPPAMFGLIPSAADWVVNDWTPITDAVNLLPLFADFYTDNGVHIPMHQIHYQFTHDRALVFCIEERKEYGYNLDTDSIYCRFYTNAYFESDEANGNTINTKVSSVRIFSNADILAIQNLETQWKNQEYCVFSYINGNLVDSLTMLTVKIGDVVDCVVDTSVKRIVDFKLSELDVFTSLRDHKQKYLVHYPVQANEAHVIDFVDDIDVYLYSKTGDRFLGRYVHRNQTSTMRMVTHRDYALAVEPTVGILDALTTDLTAKGITLGEVIVRIYIRHSGLFHHIGFEASRIKELYKLPENEIVSALIGANAVVPFWTAASLENSEYVRLLDAQYSQMTMDLLERAYGYNAISKTVADTPSLPDGNTFPLASLYHEAATVYEYDAVGVLLGFYHHTSGGYYIPTNPNCAQVECISGRGSKTPPVEYGTDDLTLPPNANYRVYMTFLEADGSTGEWRDITDSDYYTVVNGHLKWMTTDEGYLLMVRTDLGFLAYDVEITPVAGTIYFPISEITNWVGEVHEVVPVPGADIDIWLNGKALVVGVDCTIDFPNVYVFNKDYLVQPAGSTPQKLTVRMTGFCQTDKNGFVSREPTDDYGFIEHGVLSNNGRYDIRDDRVMSVYVKGCLKDRNTLTFSELHSGVSITNALNGQPYQLRERLIPFRQHTETNSETLRQRDQARDKVVGDFLTLRLPEPVRDGLSAIAERHRLFSPFFSHLVNDLQSGQFPMSELKHTLIDQDVIRLCEPYMSLLTNDPLNEKLGLDYRIILIHPHQLDTTILLDVESYSFLKRVVKLFGKNLISLNGHLNINATGSNG